MSASNIKMANQNAVYDRWLYSKQNSCKYVKGSDDDCVAGLRSDYDEEKSRKISEMKRLLNRPKSNNSQQKSIVESSLSYSESLRESRNAAKNTATEIKKLKYSFKDISSQIRSSKTSASARQVASKARREVIQLKMKLQSGQYDEEEITAAIEHAKSMERVAKKKARHLEEEELIKITDKEGYDTTASDLEQQIEEQEDRAYDEYDELADEIEMAIQAHMEESSEEMYELIADSIEEIIEESLGDLSDSMMMVTDTEMNEDELKTFRMKHRQSEEKAMLEADAKYLKAIFDIYDRKMCGSEAGSMPISSVAIDASCGDMISSIPNIVDVSL